MPLLEGTGFPYNVSDVLKEHLALQYDEPGKRSFTTIIDRPPMPEDPNRTVAVFPADWTPRDKEIMGGPGEPSLARYDLRIYLLVSGQPQQYVRRVHGALTKKIRAMIYRDQDFLMDLRSLVHVDEHVIKERYMRSDISTQRYLANEVRGTLLCVSVTNFWVDVETSG